MNITKKAISALIKRDRSSMRCSIKGALVASMSSWLMTNALRAYHARHRAPLQVLGADCRLEVFGADCRLALPAIVLRRPSCRRALPAIVLRGPGCRRALPAMLR